MIKQLSHTQFSFKPRQKALNDSFTSDQQVPYDFLISTILSKATLTNEMTSLYEHSDNKISTLIELNENNALKAKPLKSNAIVMKSMIPRSPLNSIKIASKINNFRVVSYIKHKIEPESVEGNNKMSTRTIFSNKTIHLKSKRSIPHPSSNKVNSKQLSKIFNINVNVFIQSSNNVSTQESKSKSSVTVIPLSRNNPNIEANTTKKRHKNLLKEREIRRMNKQRAIAERQNSLEEIRNKIHLLSGTFSEIKHKKTCSYFKGREASPYLKNRTQIKERFMSQNSIHSLESYDKESL